MRSDAARDARLPVARIRELLDDPDRGVAASAASAAANPALPPEGMHRILDLAGVPEIRVNHRTSGC
ncbi:hypothetical protein AB0N09_25015 [Streptomyces erythrochromogenes]|uniref:hypothetical protein n=1 Tax=Streptomyces erythrochromogenes TaxID=285574 RepID=UPI0034170763